MSNPSVTAIARVLDHFGNGGASDIHLTSNRGGFYVKDKQTRRMPAIDGFSIDETLVKGLIAGTVTGGLDGFDSRNQSGASFDTGGKFRGRVAVRREEGGLSSTIRIISRDIPTTTKLDLPKNVVQMIAQPSGLVLLVGQTGSGKSTTIAAMVNLVNQQMETGIYTLESPIEYLYPEGKSLVIQREVGTHVGSFAEGIEDAKRSHPRIIVVGEILNAETARSALLAAASGHLVVSTMHAGTAAEAVDSFTSMFTPEEQGLIRTQLAASLVGIVAQKLIPKTAGGMALAQEVAFNSRSLAELVRGSGNRSNDTKFIQQLLTSPQGEQQGMKSMERSLAQLVKDGQITHDAAVTNARDREALEEKFTQIGVPPVAAAA